MEIKGLVFDLDGVITDTARLHYLAWKEVLARHNISYTESENDLLKGLSRRSTLIEILKFKKIEWDDNKIDEICDVKNKLYVEMLNKELSEKDILPGIKQLLDDAKKIGLKLAIASSSRNAPLILQKLGIEKYFDYIVNVNDIKNGKPDPEIYLNAVENLKLEPHECIGFEDAFFGVIGLTRANMNVVSISNGIKEMYVSGCFVVENTEQLNLQNILNYFLSTQRIDYGSILHHAFGRYAYQNSTGDTLNVILRTKKSNINYVNIRYGDPFAWKKKEGPDVGVTQFGGDETMYWEEEGNFMMDKYLSDKYFDYYKAKIKTKSKRVRYAFEINGLDGSTVLYGERGFADTSESIAQLGFTWGYLHEGNLSNIPKWVSKIVWYQIFPERFWNGDKTNDNKGTLEWNSAEPTVDNYFGGDLQGVIDKLDHLVELGVTGIYFTPIFKANTNHKYDTEDYLKIDPHFGDEKKFKELIEQCHSRGIKVMIDAVFNHCGSKFKPWLDVVKNKENSKYKDWFFINNFNNLKHAHEYPTNYFLNNEYVYETFAFTPFMPRLNWSNPEVKNYFKKVVKKWTKLGIDGWRLDVANEPPLDFWRSFRKWAKDINPEIYILGEVWYNSSLYLNGDTFDGVMNYTLRDAILNSIKHNWNAKKIQEVLSQYLLIYNNPIKRGMFNLLGSHDTPRILTMFENNVNKFMIAYRIMFHMLGSVCVYYGDEIGMDGEHDPGCRKCMQWDKTKWNNDIFKMFKNLIKMRKDYSILTNHEFKFIDQTNEHELFEDKLNEELLCFKLYRKEEKVYCIVNLTNNPININLSKSNNFYDIYMQKDIEQNYTLRSLDMLTLKVK